MVSACMHVWWLAELMLERTRGGEHEAEQRQGHGVEVGGGGGRPEAWRGRERSEDNDALLAGNPAGQHGGRAREEAGHGLGGDQRGGLAASLDRLLARMG